MGIKIISLTPSPEYQKDLDSSRFFHKGKKIQILHIKYTIFGFENIEVKTEEVSWNLEDLFL